MTSRQARRERREAERKVQKEEYKRSRALAVSTPAPVPVSIPDAPAADVPDAVLLDEFSPETIAEANTARDRIRDRIAEIHNSGFVSQPLAPEVRFVSQAPAAPSRRAEINRQNALHSTGPRTPEGKLASSRNSLKHGLASGQLIVPGEDPAAFESLRNGLLQEHQPADLTEELLVNEMAQSYWLEQRAIRLQNECFTDKGIDEKRLALFLRYQTTHQRAFYKALHTLLRLQKNRSYQPAAGFVSQSREAAVPAPRFVSQTSDLPDPKSAEHLPPGVMPMSA